MAKQRVSAKAVAADIRSGMSDSELMEKYRLSAKEIEYLFQKLIENRIVTPAEISEIRQAPLRTVQPEGHESPSEPPRAISTPAIDPELAKAVVEDVRRGRHDYDMMVRFRLSRDELWDFMERLVRLGYLSTEEVEARRPREITQCSYCHSEVIEGDVRCKNCGRDVIRPISSAPLIRPEVKAERPLSEEISDDHTCPWEDYWRNRCSLGPLRAYFRTVSRCIVSPSNFFSKLPLDLGYWSPTLFGAVSAALPTALTLVWFELLTGGASTLGLGGLISLFGIMFLVFLVIASIGLFIWSLLVHGSLMLLGGAHRRFQATFRVGSYSCAASLFGTIPVIGGLVGILWGFYLSGSGLRQTHKTSAGKAFGAVLIPIVVVAVAWMMFGLQYDPLIAWKQSSSEEKPATSRTYSGTEFKTDVGKFSVFSPSPLTEKKVHVDTVLGKMAVSVFSVKHGNIEYSIICSDSGPSYVQYLHYLPHFFRSYDPER